MAQSRVEYARTEPGLNIYALKRPKPDAAGWEAAAIAMPPDPNDPGSYVLGGISFEESYEVFQQLGAKPEPTDRPFWDFPAMASGGLGVGPLRLSVRCEEPDADGIGNALVDILGTAYAGLTDSFGNVQFNLSPGDYTIRVTPPAGYESPNDRAVTLDSDSSELFILPISTPVGGGPGWLG